MNESADDRWDASRAEEHALTVAVGNAAFEHGRTTVRLTGDGTLSGANVVGGERIEFEEEVGAARARELLADIVESGVWDRPLAARRGIPDEARFELQLLRAERSLGRVEVWEGELQDLPELRKLLEELREVVKAAVNGRVLFW